jgi:hypothetical protein
MTYDIWVDFQRMLDDGRLLARTRNARPGFTVTPGAYVLVGCEDAEAAVAHVLTVSADGSVELQVLPGPADEHLALLGPTG